jgi:hypothetical protein
MADKLIAERGAGQVGKQWPRNFVKRTDSLATRFKKSKAPEPLVCSRCIKHANEKLGSSKTVPVHHHHYYNMPAVASNVTASLTQIHKVIPPSVRKGSGVPKQKRSKMQIISYTVRSHAVLELSPSLFARARHYGSTSSGFLVNMFSSRRHIDSLADWVLPRLRLRLRFSRVSPVARRTRENPGQINCVRLSFGRCSRPTLTMRTNIMTKSIYRRHIRAVARSDVGIMAMVTSENLFGDVCCLGSMPPT